MQGIEGIRQLFENRVLWVAIAGWLSAQIIKVFINWFLTGKFQPERLWGAGGMPSAHSSMVCALTMAVSRTYGVAHPLFAVALIFAFVTVYDAMGVRRETGRHAKLLNRYLNEIEQEKADINGDGLPEKQVVQITLKELIGHTPMEVVGGVILGIVIGLALPIS